MILGGVVLAGGQSRRMGHPKAELLWEGRPLLTRQLELLRDCGAAPAWVSCRSEQIDGLAPLVPEGTTLVVDRHEHRDCGPLGGISAVLRASRESEATHLLVLAVDLPDMTASHLRTLWASCEDGVGAIPETAHGLQPLSAIYPVGVLAECERCLAAGERRVRAWAEGLVQIGVARRIRVSESDEGLFRNLNRPPEPPPELLQ